MTLEQYIENINKRYKAGNATEHTFRGDLQQLIESLVPGVTVTNEPKRQAYGAPDYILTRNNIPLGNIEAKDIDDQDLEGIKPTGNKEQFDRYKAASDNIIFTDYLQFHLYHYDEFITKIAIGEIKDGKIAPLVHNFQAFKSLIRDFCTQIGQTIKSPKQLAEMMAGKARALADTIEKALTSDEANREDSSLKEQMDAFKQILMHDITPKGFSDIYAQTVVYGMFAARSHDPSLDTFSRQEAAELIPKSNPFLRRLFGYIAGPEIDDRIKWIVDALVKIFLACDADELLRNYGKATKTEDPIIHFYETFLSEYDPKLRKSRGVWYTPKPVVDFIVRAVDDILKSEFDLPNGLADNCKTKIKVNIQGKPVKQEVHKVQILDPATGTGTFLAEVVRHIHKKFEGQQGIWSNYVETHLLPRLNGFELLMASYAMAHLKLDLLLTETGYKPAKDQRFRVYLTNSLEEEHPDTGSLFASWLSAEANEANHIKRDTPVMVIMGNPPYLGESANKGKWIMKLMEDYKKEPGGKEKLKERNSKWINDDYVKFLRYGQHFIEKNGSGILAFINPHGYLDNPTFRGMRWNLLKTYDKIYTIDLHGNSKKKETAPDGSTDTNVFNILQGVSINIFVKTGKKKDSELGRVFHYDLYGKREHKFDFLYDNTIKTVPYKELTNVSPNYFFVDKNLKEQEKYESGFRTNDLFVLNTLGIVTANDAILINESRNELLKKVGAFYKIIANPSIVQRLSYRPFDDKFVYYDTGILERAREKVMCHFLGKENVGFNMCKIGRSINSHIYFLSKHITDKNLVSSLDSVNTFPLYLYPGTNGQQTIGQTTHRTPNLKPEIVNQIAERLGLKFTPEKEKTKGAFTPIDILDYIYAVLHSPNYREKYKEFLKIDFPRVPYPKDLTTFQMLSNLGSQLRQVHLLESSVVEKYITQYPIDGSNLVQKVRFVPSNPLAKSTKKIEVEETIGINSEMGDNISFPQYHLKPNEDQLLHEPEVDYKPVQKNDGLGKVWINDTQYFDNVPELAWNFYIGGYQPAQKWLKDRKGRILEFDDILHYQKIIAALAETERLIKGIDEVEIEE